MTDQSCLFNWHYKVKPREVNVITTQALGIQHKIKMSGSDQDWLSAKNYIIDIAIRLWKKIITGKRKWGYNTSLEN